jgi:hypothetical protein
MHVNPRKRHDAGIELWKLAQIFKQYRSDVTDQMALRLAILANPDLGEIYLGSPVRRDAVGEVKKFLLG